MGRATSILLSVGLVCCFGCMGGGVDPERTGEAERARSLSNADWDMYGEWAVRMFSRLLGGRGSPYPGLGMPASQWIEAIVWGAGDSEATARRNAFERSWQLSETYSIFCRALNGTPERVPRPYEMLPACSQASPVDDAVRFKNGIGCFAGYDVLCNADLSRLPPDAAPMPHLMSIDQIEAATTLVFSDTSIMLTSAFAHTPDLDPNRETSDLRDEALRRAAFLLELVRNLESLRTSDSLRPSDPPIEWYTNFEARYPALGSCGVRLGNGSTWRCDDLVTVESDLPNPWEVGPVAD